MADDVTHPQSTRFATESSKLAAPLAAAAILVVLYIAVIGADVVPVDLVTANCGCLPPRLECAGNRLSPFTLRRVGVAGS